jgi:hypothetical protein
MEGFPKTKLFTKYCLLGDDIVIGSPRVAKRYLMLMEILGVECNPSKALISRNGSAEFAKRFFYKGEDLSPISFREFSTALSDLPSWVAFSNK